MTSHLATQARIAPGETRKEVWAREVGAGRGPRQRVGTVHYSPLVHHPRQIPRDGPSFLSAASGYLPREAKRAEAQNGQPNASHNNDEGPEFCEGGDALTVREHAADSGPEDPEPQIRCARNLKAASARSGSIGGRG